MHPAESQKPLTIALCNEETDPRMPHRKLVRIGETPTLPTISQFLNEMAARQHEEIQRLKAEALNGRLPDPTVPEPENDVLTPDAWQLHPVRVKRPPKKAATKRSAKSSKKARKPKVAKKVISKKVVGRKKK